jgi:AraC-like DNA-binding protein
MCPGEENRTQEEKTGEHGPPLIRLSLLIPFIQELERRQVKTDRILVAFDLNRETLANPESFVQARVIYKLLEAMAQAADDPFLAVHVGETLDLYAWPVLTDAIRQSVLLGDFLIRISIEALTQASSVQMRLETGGQHAWFHITRVFDPGISPAQADGFYVGLFSAIFRRCTGARWDPSQVLIRLCDPKVVPPGYHQLNLAQGDRLGPSIRFPQQWLLYPFDKEDFKHRTKLDITYSAPPTSLKDAIRQALLPYLHKADLSIDQAAELCGYNKRSLGRKLQAQGTTIAKEIARLREEQVIRLLITTNNPIGEIANAVGFTDSNSLSRSFKQWTGLSPREYRKRHKPHTSV